MGLGKMLVAGQSSLGLPSHGHDHHHAPRPGLDRTTSSELTDTSEGGVGIGLERLDSRDSRSGSERDTASFSATDHQSSSRVGGVGTSGWQAPEIMALRSVAEAQVRESRRRSMPRPAPPPSLPILPSPYLLHTFTPCFASLCADLSNPHAL